MKLLDLLPKKRFTEKNKERKKMNIICNNNRFFSVYSKSEKENHDFDIFNR